MKLIRVADLQGGSLVEFEGRTWLITRLLWAPNAQRDVRMEPWPEGGPSIERTFFQRSEVWSGSVPIRNSAIV